MGRTENGDSRNIAGCLKVSAGALARDIDDSCDTTSIQSVVDFGATTALSLM